MGPGPSGSAIYGGLFGDEELAELFSDDAEIRSMIRFEAALALVESRLGVIPEDAGPAIAGALRTIPISPESLRMGTASAGVPVPALVAALRDAVAAPHGAYIHWGATSQDVIDSGLILRLSEACAILETRLETLTTQLAKNAERYAETVMAGRTRSQIATPVTFGLRIAGWLAPLDRCRERLAELRPRLLVLQFGGASGALGALGSDGTAVMEALASELGLNLPCKPWHTERDCFAEFGGWLSLVTGTLGRMGGDMILMGRSEIGEATAGAGGGSSTMPQKQNPVLAETLVALARANAGRVATLHNALLHQEERDSTAWSLEWLTLPEMLIAAGTALRHAISIAETLAPVPGRMASTLGSTEGAVLAEAASFALARHMPLGEAQALVKRAAREAREAGGHLIDHVKIATDAPIDWQTFKDPAQHAGSARSLVARTLAAHKRRDVQ